MLAAGTGTNAPEGCTRPKLLIVTRDLYRQLRIPSPVARRNSFNDAVSCNRLRRRRSTLCSIRAEARHRTIPRLRRELRLGVGSACSASDIESRRASREYAFQAGTMSGLTIVQSPAANDSGWPSRTFASGSCPAARHNSRAIFSIFSSSVTADRLPWLSAIEEPSSLTDSYQRDASAAWQWRFAHAREAIVYAFTSDLSR